MSLSREDKPLKEFKTISPVGKRLVTRVYYGATANNAKRFLEAVHTDLPHDLFSVPVDGGSEFMADFEQACQDLARIRHQLSSRGRRGAVLRGHADRRAMQAYLTVRQIGRREHGRAGRVHRRPQQEVGDGCGLDIPLFVLPPRRPQYKGLRRTGQQHHTRRVVESLRRRVHRRQGQSRPG